MLKTELNDGPAFRDIHIGIARFQVKTQGDREFAEQFKESIATAPPNPDKLQFEIYRDATDALKFVLYQTFTNAGAWEAHRTHPETRKSFLASAPLFDGDPARSVWSPISLGVPIAPPDRPVGYATITLMRTKPTSGEELIEQFRLEGERQKAHSQLIRQDLSRNVDDPLELMLFSRWPTREAWDADQSAPAHQQWREQTQDAIAGPVLHTYLDGFI